MENSLQQAEGNQKSIQNLDENKEQDECSSSGSDLEKKSLSQNQDVEQNQIGEIQQKKIVENKELSSADSVKINQPQNTSDLSQVKKTQIIVSKQKVQPQELIAQKNNDQKIEKIEKQVKQVKQVKQDASEDSWDDDSKFQESQEQEEQRKKGAKFEQQYSEIDGVSQYDVGVDYEDVRKFTEYSNNKNNMVLSGLQDAEEYKSFEHSVQKKHLLVLYLLFRKEVYELCKGNTKIDLHPSNKGKMTIFGKNQNQINQLLKIVENMIDKISIVKLQIRYDQAVKMKISRKLTAFLQMKKLIIFKYGQQGDKKYYIGGKGSQSSVLQQFQLLNKLKYKYFKLYEYRNTRSYKIIFEQILNFPIIVKTFQKKWSLKYLQLVDYIPNNNGPSKEMSYQFKKQKQVNICILMTSYSNDLLSPKQIQVDLCTFIKTNFYCVTLIFNKTEQYLPKLNVEGIKFRIISEKKFRRSYLYIICQKKDYQLKLKEIIQAIDKMKQEVYGARYFNGLSPSFKQYLKPQHYKFRKFPEHNPYSQTIFAKKQYKFDWKEYLMNISTVQVQEKKQ